MQYRVEVFRISGDSYEATVFHVNDDKQGTAAKTFNKNGDFLAIESQNDIEDFAIIRTGEMGEGGTQNNRINFNYGDPPFFKRSSNFQGCDANYAGTDSNFYQPDGYCKMSNIENNEKENNRIIDCYFSCAAPENG